MYTRFIPPSLRLRGRHVHQVYTLLPKAEREACTPGYSPLPKAGWEACTPGLYLPLRLDGRHVHHCMYPPSKAGWEAYTPLFSL